MPEPDEDKPKPIAYTEGVSHIGGKGCLQIFIVLGIPILILLYFVLRDMWRAGWL